MKIAKYVGELLFNYECVVIPGLGGFIAEDKAVTINEVADKFSPPYRKIHFNIHLRANDGLLVNYVAQEEQIGYKTSKLRVDKFVLQCHNALNEGKKINFKHIGTIYFDEEKNIVFQQEEKINYNADSFGLTSLVSPSIRRITDEEKVKKVVQSAVDKSKQRLKPVDKTDAKKPEDKKRPVRTMQANRRKSSFTNQLIFLAVVVFAMGISYMYMRRDAMSYYFDRYASHFPLFYTSVNDYLATNINSTPVAKLSRGTASFFPFVLNNNADVKETNDYVILDKEGNKVVGEALLDNNAVQEPIVSEVEEDGVPVIIDGVIKSKKSTEGDIKIEDVAPNGTSDEIIREEIISDLVNQPDATPSVQNISPDRYFVIAGSFSSEANANNLVKELKNEGYNALIADTNKYGMYRVAFMSFNIRNIANQKLLTIRNDVNPEAWLLVK